MAGRSGIRGVCERGEAIRVCIQVAGFKENRIDITLFARPNHSNNSLLKRLLSITNAATCTLYTPNQQVTLSSEIYWIYKS